MSKEKKTAIILGVILGVAIAIVAILLFRGKDDEVVESVEEADSLFDTPIYNMDRGYIEDEELIERIRLACQPYADNLSEYTTFYTKDGNELYANVIINEFSELMVYVNLQTGKIDYEVKEFDTAGLPGDALD